ncbi:alpha-2-HS-glycoprotein 1 [Stigmatopora nigra]
MASSYLFVAVLCLGAILPDLSGATSPPVATCDPEQASAAADVVVRHINGHHKHGYKFRLAEVLSSNYQPLADNCVIDLQLKLSQTNCHVTNPQSYDRCEVSAPTDRGASATCNIRLSVTGGAANVLHYNCDTQADPNNSELSMICPDCPTLTPLDSEVGRTAVQAAVRKYNQETNHLTYFGLMEISKLTSYYIPAPNFGTMMGLEFAMVETVCSKDSRMVLEACSPRCPQRAHHVFCKTAYKITGGEVDDLKCEMYPAIDNTPLAEEPKCVLFHGSPEDEACHHQLTVHQKDVHQICPFTSPAA